MNCYNLTVDWVRQGKKNWEFWWVFLKGKTTTREPNRKDHISFANFDLNKAGSPTLTVNGDNLYLYCVPSTKLTQVEKILEKHGFIVLNKEAN